MRVLPLEPGPGEGNILQVDPATNQVAARIEIPLPGTVFAPALGEGYVPALASERTQRQNPPLWTRTAFSARSGVADLPQADIVGWCDRHGVG